MSRAYCSKELRKDLYYGGKFKGSDCKTTSSGVCSKDDMFDPAAGRSSDKETGWEHPEQLVQLAKGYGSRLFKQLKGF